jgi:murein DD-endopeptidase MepM/ murein hydrolase activator NlpD
MRELQAELDASTAKVEAAHSREEELGNKLTELEKDADQVRKETEKLQAVAAKRARDMYIEGNTGMLEILFDGASNVSDLASRAEMLSRVSLEGSEDFIALARSKEHLDALLAEVEDKRGELEGAEEDLQDEADRLQDQLDSVSDEYVKLQRKLGAAAPAATQTVVAASAPAPPSGKASGGMFCPVGGPVSFVDSYGAPRSGGRSHEGVDMMAAYDTPEIAIVSGTITYAGYSSLGGNVMYLSGDDGNLYIYIHSATQTSGGHVSAGQQIGTVGDTGNAAGMPHLHFEYHPGGGGSVDPTPLVASIC